jgi:hypothetical protein
MGHSVARRGAIAALSLSSLAWSQGAQPESLLLVLSEDFQARAQSDARSTSADWADAYPGALRPGRGGGYGVHGDLRVEQGEVVIDVEHALPPTATRFGVWLGPIDGAFHFASVYVAPGATLRFVGAHGARIHAATLEVQGTLDVSGRDAPLHYPKNDPCATNVQHPWITNDTGRGGHGGRGGPGGGDGGSGGDDPRPILFAPHGMPPNPGSTARLPPEHLDGENGRGPGGGFGSPRFPATAIDPDPDLRLANVRLEVGWPYSMQRAGGAGGGSFASSGQRGIDQLPFTGLAGAAGPMPSFDGTLPPRRAFGGSGGGGGGVHPYFTNIFRLGACLPSYPFGRRPLLGGSEVVEVWQTGAGGGGGGGYLYVQCVELELSGALCARGGAGGSSASFGISVAGTEAGAGGGGGSGGAIRLDVLRHAQVRSSGTIDVSGGAGGRSSLYIHGGDGGRGVVHVRDASGSSAFAAAVRPAGALSTGSLQASDSHPFSFATSRYYRSQVGRPVQRIIDSILTFAITRDGAPSPVDPTDPRQVFNVGVPGSLLVHLGPAYVSYQAAQDDGTGNPVPGTETLWTADPTRLDPAKTLVRFALLLDRSWFDPLGPIAGIVGFELHAL